MQKTTGLTCVEWIQGTTWALHPMGLRNDSSLCQTDWYKPVFKIQMDCRDNMSLAVLNGFRNDVGLCWTDWLKSVLNVFQKQAGVEKLKEWHGSVWNRSTQAWHKIVSNELTQDRAEQIPVWHKPVFNGLRNSTGLCWTDWHKPVLNRLTHIFVEQIYTICVEQIDSCVECIPAWHKPVSNGLRNGTGLCQMEWQGAWVERIDTSLAVLSRLTTLC